MRRKLTLRRTRRFSPSIELISGQTDGYFPVSGRDQQALCHAAEFPRVADEQTVQKDCGTIRIYRQFDLGGDGWHLETQIFHHLHENSLLFSGSSSTGPARLDLATIRQTIAATRNLLRLLQPQLEDKARRKLRRLAQRLLNIDHELDHLTPK